jgi:uncharacterized protein (TIGR00730 family)
MQRICVFCGSSPGARPEYGEAARALARALARRGMGLVYGGSKVGVMYELAAAALEAGTEVIGVIPQGLVDREVAFAGLSDLRVVGTMHERKALMAELSDGFIALPGGLGTLEELLEIVTWAQLGLHEKPCGLLNICGYFDSLMAFLRHAAAERFVRPEHLGMLLVERDPETLLTRCADYRPVRVDKAGWALGLAAGGA